MPDQTHLQGEHTKSNDDLKLTVHIRADVAPGTQLKLTLEKLPDDFAEPEAHNFPRNKLAVEIIPWLKTVSRIVAKIPFVRANVILGFALTIYLITRLVGLQYFPIYFFTDEAVQTVQAADLWYNNLFSAEGEFLPTYFYNGYQYNLSLSVYWQVIPYFFFGKSVFFTRAASVLGSLVAAVSIALIIMRVFKLPRAWAAVLLLSSTPAWFLHSRTAFETSLATSFYALFLFCYLMYRTASPRWIYAAVAAGAMTFYSYSPARLVVGVTTLLFLLFDLRYHWTQRRFILPALGLTGVLALPLLRFEIVHPGANIAHLTKLNSYWVHDIPFWQKMSIFWQEYTGGLNPSYWFLTNNQDLVRHTMKGYGNIQSYTIPFAIVGLVKCFRNIKQPQNRVILASILAAPTGAALVGVGITRSLTMVIPIVLLNAIGLAEVLDWVQKRWAALNQKYLSAAVFLILGGYNIFMLEDALVNGPTWYTDYGLGGMQYGASQVSDAIREDLLKKPKPAIVLSPSWTNGADTVMRFFFDDPLPFSMGSIEGFINTYQPLNENTVFIMIPEEINRVYESQKFKDIRLDKVIPYPNGQPGFTFVRLQYVDDIAQIFATEREMRRILQVTRLPIDGEEALVKYSMLDMGSIEKVFDGDDETISRTAEANPMEIQIDFINPRIAEEVLLRVGGTPTQVIAEVVDDSGQKTTYENQVPESTTPRYLSISFGSTIKIQTMRLLIKSTRDEEPAHVHLWEVKIK